MFLRKLHWWVIFDCHVCLPEGTKLHQVTLRIGVFPTLRVSESEPWPSVGSTEMPCTAHDLDAKSSLDLFACLKVDKNLRLRCLEMSVILVFSTQRELVNHIHPSLFCPQALCVLNNWPRVSQAEQTWHQSVVREYALSSRTESAKGTSTGGSGGCVGRQIDNKAHSNILYCTARTNLRKHIP